MAALTKVRTTLAQCRLLSQAAPQAWASFSSAASDGVPPPPTSANSDSASGSGRGRAPAAGGSPAQPQPGTGSRPPRAAGSRLPPRGRGRGTRLADSIGVDVDNVRPQGRGKDSTYRQRVLLQQPNESQGGAFQGLRGPPPPDRQRPPRDDRQQGPRHDRTPWDDQAPPTQCSPGSRGGPRSADNRSAAPSSSIREPSLGRSSRAGEQPQQQRLPSPRWSKVRVLGRPDYKPRGRDPPMVDPRAAAEAAAAAEDDGAPGSTQRRPRGLAARQGAAAAPRGRSRWADAEQGPPPAASRARGPPRGRAASDDELAPSAGRRDQRARQPDSDEEPEPAKAPLGARGLQLVDHPQTDYEIEGQLARVYGFDNQEQREAERVLAQVAAQRAELEAQGLPQEPRHDYEPSQIEYQYEDHAVADFTRSFYGELDKRRNFEFSSEAPRKADGQSPAEFLEVIKADLMRELQLDEEHWAAHVEEALEGFQEVHAEIGGTPAQEEEQSLDALVAEQLPSDHPLYRQVATSVEVIKRNPHWNFQQKHGFVRRLVTDMRAAV